MPVMENHDDDAGGWRKRRAEAKDQSIFNRNERAPQQFKHGVEVKCVGVGT